jgi:hypothetical protein
VTEARKSALSDDSLRKLYGAFSAATDHPSEDALLALLEHAPSSDARERVVDHVSRCGECADVLRHLARCDECPPETGVKPLTTQARSTRAWGLWSGLAAAAAVTAFLAWPPGPKPHDTPPDGEALRAGAAVGLAPVAPLGPQRSAPTAFRWNGVPDALTYRVVVRDARGEPVFSSGPLSETTCPWPAATALAPGSYTWQVVAGTRSGEETTSSLAHFSLH